jgi:hypothetical protein
LPDRWVALAYRNPTEVGRAFSRVVADPLALTVGPDTLSNDTVDISGNQLHLDSP